MWVGLVVHKAKWSFLFMHKGVQLMTDFFFNVILEIKKNEPHYCMVV